MHILNVYVITVIYFHNLKTVVLEEGLGGKKFEMEKQDDSSVRTTESQLYLI